MAGGRACAAEAAYAVVELGARGGVVEQLRAADEGRLADELEDGEGGHGARGVACEKRHTEGSTAIVSSEERLRNRPGGLAPTGLAPGGLAPGVGPRPLSRWNRRAGRREGEWRHSSDDSGAAKGDEDAAAREGAERDVDGALADAVDDGVAADAVGHLPPRMVPRGDGAKEGCAQRRVVCSGRGKRRVA